MCSRLKLLREVRLVQRLFAQMVMWRKTGDRFAVGKKERPMGARLAHHEKARPSPCSSPCSLLLLARSSWWWVGSEVRSRLKFLGANGDVAKSQRPPLWRRQKSATNGCEAGSGAKKQGQPLACPLAPTPCSSPCCGFRGCCGGRWCACGKGFLCKWWCGEKRQHKSAANGHETGSP